MKLGGVNGTRTWVFSHQHLVPWSLGKAYETQSQVSRALVLDLLPVINQYYPRSFLQLVDSIVLRYRGMHTWCVHVCLFIQQQILIKCLGPGSILGAEDKAVHTTDEASLLMGSKYHGEIWSLVGIHVEGPHVSSMP